MSDEAQIGEDEVPLPEKWKHDHTIKLRLTQIANPRPNWWLDGVYRDRGLGTPVVWRVVLLHDGEKADVIVAKGETFDLAFMNACADAMLHDQKEKTDGQ